MADNEFMLKLLATLDKSGSKRQLNNDIKDLEKVVRTLRLTATLTKGTTKQQLNQTIKQLEGQLSHIKLQAKLDRKNIKADVDKALQNISFKDIDINVDSGKTKLKVQKVIADAKKVTQNNPISLNIDLKKDKFVFCKHFLHKIAKSFCRLLQLHFVGYCKASCQAVRPDRNTLQTLFNCYNTRCGNGSSEFSSSCACSLK